MRSSKARRVREAEAGGYLHEDGVAPVREMAVAFLRSPLTDALGQCAGYPVAVIAATEDPEALRRRLSASRHGAWSIAPSSYPAPFQDQVSIDTTYAILPVEASWMQGRTCPPTVRIAEGMLRAQVPAVADVRDFDRLVEIALADMRFDVIACEPREVRRRHAASAVPTIGPRYACFQGHPQRPMVLVRNIFRFRRGDLADVVNGIGLAARGLSIHHAAAHKMLEPRDQFTM